MKKNTRSRLLSSLLALALVCSLLPHRLGGGGRRHHRPSVGHLPQRRRYAGPSPSRCLAPPPLAGMWLVSGSGVTASIPNGVLNITAASDAADNATATLTVTASCDSPAQPAPL